ncbi:hypothetical protein ACGFXC_10425 [Streptomyces sp. NPDC048507]|uniref:hypothetical protein n=1 Tax=Streptomyces sp. NPDC048507 TaxID=3365560 RepID=UPI003712A161
MSDQVPEHLLPQQVVQVRPARVTDAYGSETWDYEGGATRTPITGWIQQDSRARAAADGRDQQTEGWLLITNHQDTGPLDQYEWQGLTFETNGPPNPVFTPRGLHHREVALVIYTG